MHGCNATSYKQALGLWQLTPTKQKSRPEIKALGKVKGERKLAQSSRSSCTSIERWFIHHHCLEVLLWELQLTWQREERKDPKRMVLLEGRTTQD